MVPVESNRAATRNVKHGPDIDLVTNQAREQWLAPSSLRTLMSCRRLRLCCAVHLGMPPAVASISTVALQIAVQLVAITVLVVTNFLGLNYERHNIFLHITLHLSLPARRALPVSTRLVRTATSRCS